MRNKKNTILKIAIAFGLLVTVALVIKKKDMTFRQSILKKMYPVVMWMSQAKGQQLSLENKTGVLPNSSIYELQMNVIDGTKFDFTSLKGIKILIVNTASDCGFTSQYQALENLQQQYKGQLTVIGFPSNDFKNQESKDNQAIATFCKKNYGISFPLMEKSKVVKAKNQNQVYEWLSEKQLNGWCNQAPSWNFCKYLINEKGVLVNYFPMSTDPFDPLVIAAIEKKY